MQKPLIFVYQSECLNHFRACVRMKPTDAVAYFQLGNALQATGKGHDAVTHYRNHFRSAPVGFLSSLDFA